jgi:hypothetical protein
MINGEGKEAYPKLISGVNRDIMLVLESELKRL